MSPWAKALGVYEVACLALLWAAGARIDDAPERGTVTVVALVLMFAPVPLYGFTLTGRGLFNLARLFVGRVLRPHWRETAIVAGAACLGFALAGALAALGAGGIAFGAVALRGRR